MLGLIPRTSLSSFFLPISHAFADILSDIDDHISSSSVMRSKKISELRPYPGICSRHYHCFDGSSCPELVLCQSLLWDWGIVFV